MISSRPFINPAARHTGPVVPPAVQETLPKGGESKPIKKAHKSSKSDKAKRDFGPQATASSGPVLDIPGPGDDIQEPVFNQCMLPPMLLLKWVFSLPVQSILPVQNIKLPVQLLCSPKHPNILVRRAILPVFFQPAPYPLAAAASSVFFSGPGFGVSDTDYRDLPEQDTVFLMLRSPELMILL